MNALEGVTTFLIEIPNNHLWWSFDVDTVEGGKYLCVVIFSLEIFVLLLSDIVKQLSNFICWEKEIEQVRNNNPLKVVLNSDNVSCEGNPYIMLTHTSRTSL